jgi:nicotinamide-nucleotide amidase
MDLELVTVGTELLLGHTVDTNAADLSRALASVGARVVRTTTVGDIGAAVRSAVGAALDRTGFVVTTGGLGPTRDDVTKRAVADLFGVELELDQGYLQALEHRWASLGRKGPMPEANTTQAEVPAGATVLPNRLGTAPGLWLESERGIAVLLPGVPHEARTLVAEQVCPRIAERLGPPQVARSLVLRSTGVPESALADRVRPVEAELGSVSLAYLPDFSGVDLRLTTWNSSSEADALLRRAADRLRAVLGDRVYGEGDTDLAEVVVGALAQKRLRLSVAESCTGGLVGARITEVPGASAVFAGGVIAYSDQVKTRELGVSGETLARHGAVSEEAVREMATGVASRFGTQVGLAVSGIAGPEGGTVEKPVGTIWMASSLNGQVRARRIGLPGERNEVRERAAQSALDLLRGTLPASEPRSGVGTH